MKRVVLNGVELDFPERGDEVTIDIASDGGTMLLTYVDSSGTPCELYIDGRMMSSGNPTHGHLYLNSYPSNRGSEAYMGFDQVLADELKALYDCRCVW